MHCWPRDKQAISPQIFNIYQPGQNERRRWCHSDQVFGFLKAISICLEHMIHSEISANKRDVLLLEQKSLQLVIKMLIGQASSPSPMPAYQNDVNQPENLVEMRSPMLCLSKKSNLAHSWSLKCFLG